MASPCCRHELKLYQFLSEHLLVIHFAFLYVWPTASGYGKDIVSYFVFSTVEEPLRIYGKNSVNI